MLCIDRVVKPFLLICGLASVITTTAQTIYYANPTLENNPLDRNNPYFLIGLMRSHVLIGKQDDNGFYISVYDPKMNLYNNVAYKELALDQFRIIDAVNLGDLGLLFVAQQFAEEQTEVLYSIPFSETGVPISEAQVLDSIHVANDRAVRYRVAVSDNGKFVSVFSFTPRKHTTEVRMIALNSENAVVVHRSVSLEKPFATVKDEQIQLDTAGNAYLLVKDYDGAYLAGGLLYILPASSAASRVRPLSFTRITLRDIKMKMNPLSHNLFFYSLYASKGNEGTESGVLGLWYDIRTGTFSTQKHWKISDLTPGLSPTQSQNLAIHEPIFLKTGGMILHTEVRYSVRKSIGIHPYIGFGAAGALSYGLSAGLGAVGLNQPDDVSSEYYAEDLHVITIDKTLQVHAKNTIRKKQHQQDKTAFLGYSVVNTGSRLHYLYNKFLPSGSMVLDDYVLDAKNHMVKIPLATRQDKRFSFLLSGGKQVLPRALLVPCVFGGKLLSFSLVTF